MQSFKLELFFDSFGQKITIFNKNFRDLHSGFENSNRQFQKKNYLLKEFSVKGTSDPSRTKSMLGVVADPVALAKYRL